MTQLSSTLSRLKESTKRGIQRLQGKETIHFLHVGKTGGTAIQFALEPFAESERRVMYFHRHVVTLKDIPAGEPVVFFLRDPLTRFVSGFYSRQRQGMPRQFTPWRPNEKIAFEHFQTPNELARALSSADAEVKQKARHAMKYIGHVKYHLRHWLVSEEYLISRKADIFFIGHQENLTHDFEILKTKLQLPASVSLPGDDVNAHKNPEHIDKRLDEIATANLKQWYASDYDFLRLCRTLIDELGLHRV